MSINYMLVSTILLLIAIIIFTYRFEKRKPKAREVVLIAIMSSLTVVANLVCAYTIPLHAGTALVIISGIALGPQTGMLIGALSRFVCNFFMGQGIWTPWEMFAWGLLGLLSGVFFSKTVIIGYFDDRKKIRLESTKQGLSTLIVPIACIIFSELLGYIYYLFRAENDDTFFGWYLYLFGFIGMIISVIFIKKKLPSNYLVMTIYTFISVFVIYGGIMNLSAMIMNSTVYGEKISLSALKLLYISGVPYDALHALGASICVFVFGEAVLQKLERVKIKYGLR